MGDKTERELIEELRKRIEELERRPIYIPTPIFIPAGPVYPYYPTYPVYPSPYSITYTVNTGGCK